MSIPCPPADMNPTTMHMDVSLMSSSPKPTDNDFGIEEGSGDESNLNLLLISTVTLGGKCLQF